MILIATIENSTYITYTKDTCSTKLSAASGQKENKRKQQSSRS